MKAIDLIRTSGASAMLTCMLLMLVSVPSSRADDIRLKIGGISLGMKSSKVLAMRGEPRDRRPAGQAVAWIYSGRRVVYLRRAGGQRRVIGVTTRNRRDRFDIDSSVHVGSPARRLSRDIGPIKGKVKGPTGRFKSGDFRRWPDFVGGNGVPVYGGRQPVLLFEVRRNRIFSITLQMNPVVKDRSFVRSLR